MHPTTAGGDSTPSDEVVAVGRVGKAHGIRGDVFVEPWTDAPEQRFADGAVVYAGERERRPLTVAGSRDHSGQLVVLFAGLDERTAAEALRGTVLVVPAADRPALDDEDEFYDSDLLGLAVELLDGTPLGPVTEVLHSPAGSVLAIDRAGREVLVPFRREVVPTVDLVRRVAVIDPPEGLLDQ